MNKFLSRFLVAAGCTLAVAPGQAVVYTLNNLNISYDYGATNRSYGLPFFLTTNNNVFYQSGAASYEYSNGVTTLLPGSGTGALRGANVSGDYIIGTTLYHTPDHVYAYSGLNPTTAINDNHDSGIRESGSNPVYATFAGYSSSETEYDAYPSTANVEIEGLNNVGTGVGVTRDVSGGITSIFTSQFVPTDITEKAGTPGNRGPHDGTEHGVTGLVTYSPGTATIHDVVGVSNNGMIAGSLSISGFDNGEDQAFIGVNGTITRIGALGRATYNNTETSDANDINSLGQVVGTSTFGDVKFFNSILNDAFKHGFLYQNSLLTDLNSLLDSDSASKYTIISGLSINDGGSILAVFDSGTEATNRTFGSNQRLGLLTVLPASSVPEPATWALMTLGVGAIGFARRQDRKKRHGLSSAVR
ncbi:PEPxxWA-CTERM sorting domain-containing protein [Sphingomonas bacterium]|uniref:PEPxxWA-CTERM sorting domain-containing protein n=1 Tax=Sphingomonas bacterium TaxID=1895847 RepID=UPI001576E8BB|nr:PEPxxWA-CTERM sorting domain-containing protein [Sphingomonas bacterium]